MLALIAACQDVVVDVSSWSRARREQDERLIGDAGGRWRLIHLDVEPELLRQRLAARAGRRRRRRIQLPIGDAAASGQCASEDLQAGRGR